jgi:hypothetical protein
VSVTFEAEDGRLLLLVIILHVTNRTCPNHVRAPAGVSSSAHYQARRPFA